MIAAGALAVMLGALNLRLNRLHENRFQAHVAAASFALFGLEQSLPREGNLPSLSNCRAQFDQIKAGHLSETWAIVPKVVILAGALLVIAGFAILIKGQA